jgi:hypothetical protein
MLLAVAVRRQVLFRSLRCIVDGVHLVVGRHMRLIHRRQNVFRRVQLGCFAVVPCCVLVMFAALSWSLLSVDMDVPFWLQFLLPPIVSGGERGVIVRRPPSSMAVGYRHNRTGEPSITFSSSTTGVSVGTTEGTRPARAAEACTPAAGRCGKHDEGRR